MTNPLHDDARSAWAYRRYAAGREPGPIHPAVGAGILASLLPGDHVELIADTVAQRAFAPLTCLSRRGRPLDLAVRTLRAWFLVDRNTGGIAVLPGAPTALGYTSGADAAWEETGWTNAHLSTDLAQARARELYPGQHTRLWGYLNRAVENLTTPEAFTSPRAAVIFHHHTDLLAAVYFRELGLPHPRRTRSSELAPTPETETLADYYT